MLQYTNFASPNHNLLNNQHLHFRFELFLSKKKSMSSSAQVVTQEGTEKLTSYQ